MMSLNKEQEKAYKTNENKVLVLAGAGTGKTHTMIARIHRLVSDEHIASNSILVLTFTNAAALEMRTRYEKLVDSKTEPIPQFQTFHAFCYKLISDDFKVRNEIGYEFVPEIIDEAEYKTIRLNVKTQLNIKLSNSKLDSDGSTLSKVDKRMYDMYHTKLNSEMKKKNVITFYLLIDRVCKLFIEQSSLVAKYINKYEYLFIDEFQDTDPRQWKFAKSFNDSKLFVIGDALQAIYGFRGADSSIIKELADNNDWEVIKLHDNYRSTEDIVNYANDVVKHIPDTYKVVLSANKVGMPVVVSECDGFDQFSGYSKSTINCCYEYISNYTGSAAILVRSNAEVADVVSKLTEAGIEVNSDNEFNELKNILRAAVDVEFELNWLMSILSQEDASNILRKITVVDDELNLDSFLSFSKNSKQHNELNRMVSLVDTVKGILYSDEYPFVKCNAILDKFGVKNSTPIPEEDSPEYIVEYLSEFVDTINVSSLYVGTIHSSKGLEYDTVVVLGVDGGYFKLNTEEDINLYYVAVTRAKQNLMILRSR